MATILSGISPTSVRAIRAIYRSVVPQPLRLKLWVLRHEHDSHDAPDEHDSREHDSHDAPDEHDWHASRHVQRILAATRADSGIATAQDLSHFEQAMVEYYRQMDPNHPMLETWVRYTWDTNKRGQDTVSMISKQISVAGKRHLDIGCSFGGTSIAFAEAGVESWGLEIEPVRLQLARANLADYPNAQCTFLQGDILDSSVATEVGKVDIITCENVIEHVASARQLVEVMRSILTDDGLVLLWIPNAFSYTEVRQDGHYGLFGLTLLDRDDAIAYFEAAGYHEDYTVGEYCFTLEDYRAMFSSAGLTLELVNPLHVHEWSIDALQRDISSLPAKFAEACTTRRIPPMFVPQIEQRLHQYMRGFQAAYDAYVGAAPSEREVHGARLLQDYQLDTWYVFARPITADRLAGEKASTLPVSDG